jgi:hypothetical protein
MWTLLKNVLEPLILEVHLQTLTPRKLIFSVFDEQLKMYMLSWRGVSFCFPTKDSSTVQSSYAHGLGSLHFANSALPFLQKMTIFSGNTPAEMK